MINLVKLKYALLNNSSKEVINEIVKIKDVFLHNDEITNFFEELAPKDIDYSNYYTLTGSGGSNIIKPNITSITALYLSVLDIPILKIGSRKRTGCFGSTDFFNLLDCSKLNKFSYIDSDLMLPQLFYRNILSLNNSFKNYYEKNVDHIVSTKGKMVGISNQNRSNLYLNKNHIHKPRKLIVFYSKNKDITIDEIIPGSVYINDIKYADIPFENLSSISKNDINLLNYQLLCGTCKNTFWLNSLRYSFAIFLYEFNFETSLDSSINTFNKIYYSKKIKSILNI